MVMMQMLAVADDPLPQTARSSSGRGGWRELSCGKVASVSNLR